MGISHRIAGQSRAASRTGKSLPASTMATLRSNVWIAVITGAVGLGGALIGGWFSMAGTREAADAAAEAEQRDLRRVAYSEYIDALDAYSTASESRWASCDYGTTATYETQVREESCQPTDAEYREIMNEMRHAANNMELIASDEALRLVLAIGPTLPATGVALGGVGFMAGDMWLLGDQPDTVPETRRFDALHQAFIDVAGCDTSPNPRKSCPFLRTYAMEVVSDRTWDVEDIPDDWTSPEQRRQDRLREWTENNLQSTTDPG